MKEDRIVTEWLIDRKSGYMDTVRVDRMDLDTGVQTREAVIVPKGGQVDVDGLLLHMIDNPALAGSINTQELSKDRKLH